MRWMGRGTELTAVRAVGAHSSASDMAAAQEWVRRVRCEPEAMSGTSKSDGEPSETTFNSLAAVSLGRKRAAEKSLSSRESRATLCRGP